jgi:hypothetical protein
MGEVVSVAAWGRAANRMSVIEKFVACNRFIRSKVVPPPMGSIVFNFAGGKVTITGEVTHITGPDCDVTIQRDYALVSGSLDCADAVFCSINREIEQIRSSASCDEVVVRGLQNGQTRDVEDNALRGLIG